MSMVHPEKAKSPPMIPGLRILSTPLTIRFARMKTTDRTSGKSQGPLVSRTLMPFSIISEGLEF